MACQTQQGNHSDYAKHQGCHPEKTTIDFSIPAYQNRASLATYTSFQFIFLLTQFFKTLSNFYAWIPNLKCILGLR